MKYLKKFENLFGRKKIDPKIEWDKFEKEKAKQKPVSIVVDGKEIIYNPFDREILNDDNVGKYAVLNEYPFDIDDVKLKDRDMLTNFIRNNVGKITHASLGGGKAYYTIEYHDIPNNIKNYFSQNREHECVYLMYDQPDFISDNLEDCLTYISANKYNL